MSRALPVAALLAMALACREICAGRGLLEAEARIALAAVLLLVVVVRAVPLLLRREWRSAIGSYQASILYCAALLALSDHAGTQSTGFWALLVGGFWLMGLAYPIRLIMPGEFTFAALTSAGITSAGQPPLPDWLFALLVFGVAAVWLGRHSEWKPVLLLAALILILWSSSDVAGGHAAVVFVAAVGILWGAVYALKRLHAADSSSVMRSLGLGVVSGLLLFVSFTLFRFEVDAILPWLVSTPVFGVIALGLHRSKGAAWSPLLLLWFVHWSFALYVVVWHNQFRHEAWSVVTGGLLAALVLRAAAVRLDSNRLLVWARGYLLASVLGAVAAQPSDVDGVGLHLASALALFPIALWLARPHASGSSTPWWKGVLNPRHVVAMRHMADNVAEWIGRIPFVGAVASAIVQGFRIVIAMKRAPRRFDTGDALLVACVPTLAVMVGQFVRVAVVTVEGIVRLALDGAAFIAGTPAEQARLLEAGRAMVEHASIYAAAGVLFLIAHWVRRDPLYAMLAMVAFCASPVTIAADGRSDSPLFWISLLVSAAGIMAAKEVQDGGARPRVIPGPAPQPAR